MSGVVYDAVKAAATRSRGQIEATTNARTIGVLMAATVAWNLGGFATGFFDRAWRDASIPTKPMAYALNAWLGLALAFSATGGRRSLAVSGLLGGPMAAWSVAGSMRIGRDAKLGPLPGVGGAGVPAVLGGATAFRALSAYQRG